MPKPIFGHLVERTTKSKRFTILEVPDQDGISRKALWALTIGCSISVANIYYVQPLLVAIQNEMHTSSGAAGLVATLCQVGYALGMLFLVPLGDAKERRGLVVTMLLLESLMMLGMAFAPNLLLLQFSALLVGLCGCTPQMLVPFAAHLAGEKARGRVVGFVMSGLLIGILLARTVSGFVGAAFGWRAIFWIAAILMVGLAVVLRLTLPSSSPSSNPPKYGQLLLSLKDLLRDEPILRESAFFGACSFGAFSAFWTTLGFLLAGAPFHYTSQAVGLFGLAGVAGALAAPLAGKRGDAGNARSTVAIGMSILLASFVLMYFGAGSVILLVVGTILLDAGTQGAQVSNQSRIFALRPHLRNRINTVYMTSYFIGGSLGSAVGAWAWGVDQWMGVTIVGVVFCAAGLALHQWNRMRTTP